MKALGSNFRVLTLLLAASLASCGGGGGSTTPPPGTVPPPAPVAVVEKPSGRAEAARFLTQASFGPTDADIDRLLTVGYGPWIDEQLALPATSHRTSWQAADAAIKALDTSKSAGQAEVLESFWKQAITGRDQLRQRWVFALSQIFVISMADNVVGDQPRAVAAWLDLLGEKGLGDYRELLEAVSRQPLMGVYLSHLRNQKADARSGRVPDENYAREVMQLFSIGVVTLDEAGRAVGSNGGNATYGPSDISGLAKVFTGWSYDCPDFPANNCFSSGTNAGRSDADRWFKPMLGYPQYHSSEEKKFLGATIAPQVPADPAASLKVALDTLAAHDNVGPFIGKQLIQRLVTSNPSEAYVTAVSRAFANNGAGVRGDMAAVLKAILMHPEARLGSDRAGKLREPVLRLSALLRAFPHASETGAWKVGNTDNPGTSLGQSPLRASSVFNFYRPGYVAPGTRTAQAGLVAPEMQLMHETSASGHINLLRDAVASGVGSSGPSGKRDIQGNYSAELALADKAAELVDRIMLRLITGNAPEALKTEIVAAVSSIVIPTLAANGSNQAAVDNAKRSRVNTALLLTLVSPEFLVQK